MTPERWQRVKAILGAALEIKGERSRFLDEACQGDESLRHEVESLLAVHGQAESFLEEPAVHLLGQENETIGEGAVLDRYRLIRQLGYGGMGTVYLAVRADDEYQRQVALKLLRWQIDRDLVRRFRMERQILAQLEHPNIARLYDGGTVAGQPYFVMEYVEGEPINQFCQSRKLPVENRLEIFRSVCSAVHFAHQNLIVHRDLKPSNILVTPHGEPKLLDFGIAKIMDSTGGATTGLTVTGLRPMTPDYASPEQVRGGIVTTTSDIYSLGVILYELLTGRRPHLLKGRRPEEISEIVSQMEPATPSQAVLSGSREGDEARLSRRLVGDLDNIVLMALRKEPQRRYSSAAQLAEDIGRHLDGLPVSARKDTLVYRTGKLIRRNKLAVLATLLLVLLVTGFITGLLVQHQRALRERDRASQIADFLVDIFKISDPAQSRGEKITAREILDRGAVTVQRELKDQPEIQAAMLNTLGEVYASLGLYGRAEELMSSAVELRRRHLGPAHVELAESLDSLAVIHTLQGDYEVAEPLYVESLAISRKTVRDDHPRVDETLSHYGTFLVYRGDYAAAESVLREALRRRRRRYGNEDERFAESLSNLGSLLKIKGDYQEARSLYEEALRIRRKLHGPEHPSIAATLNNLGWLLEDIGDSGGAQPLYLEALRLRRKILGNDHPQVAATLHNLSSTFEDTGDLDAARRASREALSIWRRSLGPEHPLIANGLNKMASLSWRKGDLEGAEEMYRDALEMRRRLLPPKHRDILISLNNLAMVLQDMGNHAEAKRLFRESLRQRQELWGKEHRDVALALNNLAVLLEDMGDLQEAERLHREALSMRRKQLGDEHPDVVVSMRNLASVLCARRRIQEGENLVREALKVSRRSYPEAHVSVSQIRSVEGECLLSSGRYAEAEPLLVGSYSMIREDFHDRTRPAQKALKRVINLYHAWGRWEKVREYEGVATSRSSSRMKTP